MTTNAFAPAPTYTISGTGPYDVTFDYQSTDEILVSILMVDVLVPVDSADYMVIPEGPAASGTVFLTPGYASAHDGEILVLSRDTTVEQTWANLASTAAGLETQLDRMTRAIQESQNENARSLRIISAAVAPYQPQDGCVPYWDNTLGSFANGLNYAQLEAGIEAASTASDRVDIAVHAIGGGKWKPDVTALLADTDLTYVPDQTATVAEGDKIVTQAEGFGYAVAASGATDHDLTTAGGVKLYVLPGSDGGFTVDAFGAVGDGVTDDRQAIQSAIDATGNAQLYFGAKTYLCQGALYSHDGKAFVGSNVNATTLQFDADTNTDGLVLGWRNLVPYVNEAAFLADIATLDDGWYLIGTTDLRFVEDGAQTNTATRVLGGTTPNNTGYQIRNLLCTGVDTTSVRDLIVGDNLWRLSMQDTWTINAGGRGLVLRQCLHVYSEGHRSDHTVGHAVELTDTANTTATFVRPYLRVTHAGAGVKSDCLGVSLLSPILEGIGGGSGTDVYMPGIWIAGGSATIIHPYFEDVRGHNIFCDGGTSNIIGGVNQAGFGTLNTRYAALVVTGTAKVDAQNAGVSGTGGTKSGIFVSKDGSKNDVFLTGSGSGYFQVIATDIANPANYTECDYDVADTTSLGALTGMTSGQTAHVRNGFAGQTRDYTYNGSTWVKISSHEFNGHFVGRHGSTGNWRVWGGLLALRAGNSLSANTLNQHTQFHAGATFNNVPALQTGATIPANGTVTSGSIPLGFTVLGYSGATAHQFPIRFSTPSLANGLVVRVDFVGATSVQVKVTNVTNSPVVLTDNVRGQIIIEQWTKDDD